MDRGGPRGPAHHGIDILCDAAGSDMAGSSRFSLASAPPQQSGGVLPHRPFLGQDPAPTAPADRVFSAPSTPSHVCHICRRVYERADHLTRHLRSHENARLYQCSRCPKRFNRADLLARHETTHDRDGASKARSSVRRSDRAAEACSHCAASKSKCSDEKPCTRCRSKNLACQMPSRRAGPYRPSDAEGSISPSETSNMGSVPPADHFYSSAPTPFFAAANSVPGLPYGQAQLPDGPPPVLRSDAVSGQSAMGATGLPDETTFFNPVHNPFSEMDFSWHFDWKDFPVPSQDVEELTPQSNDTANSKPSARSVGRDASRGHAAFKRSPWLFDPEPADYVDRAKKGLTVSDESMSAMHAFDNVGKGQLRRFRMSSTARDSLFATVLSQHSNKQQVPSFPSLHLLNYLLQAHFLQEERACDNWLHAASFDPDKVVPELLGGVIANGATYISTPSIWQFGLALQEVVRIAVGNLFESVNANTRNLPVIQAYMIFLDIGQWCGFNRQMEICESFLQPMVTLLRRSGKTSYAAESAAIMPAMADSDELLEVKWKYFIKRESFKRLSLHVFFHDVQSSIGLCKNPLLSYNELGFCLPASRDLWKAASAKEWRDVWLARASARNLDDIPSVSETRHNNGALDCLDDLVDIELTYMTVLHGYWGQVAAYRDAVKFYSTSSGGNHHPSQQATTIPLWLQMQRQELYRELYDFSASKLASRKFAAQLLLLAELFMMILHVSPDELQKFAGKNGEEEARRACRSLEEVWCAGPEARYAAWHAGQVLRQARRLPPTSTRGFNVIAVYFAGLTLWAYALCSTAALKAKQSEMDKQGCSRGFVLLDGDQTLAVRAFLQLDQGLPALQHCSDSGTEMEPLTNPSMVLGVACSVLRNNFPVSDEPLPPLVQSLELLLHELGSDPAEMQEPGDSEVAK